jgi:hypothetical protein
LPDYTQASRQRNSAAVWLSKKCQGKATQDNQDDEKTANAKQGGGYLKYGTQ